MLAMIVSCAWQPASAAEPEGYPGIIGKDDRQAIQDNGPPWGAIGQVNITGYRTRGLCTGTLVAARIVLTAAHCLFDPARKVFRPENIHFVAGVVREKSLGHSIAACVKFPPGVSYVGPEHYSADLPHQVGTLKSAKQDLALLVLKDAITGVVPIPATVLKPRAKGAAVAHAAYPANRRYMLMAQRGCKVLDWGTDFIATDCDSFAGSSGGPLLLEETNEVKVVGVLSMIVKNTATIFIPLSTWDPLPLNASCP